MASIKTITACAVGITCIALSLWYRPADADDFPPFYRPAALASAHASVYANPSWSPRTNTEERFLPFLRTPSYAEALRPLAALPYPFARGVWIAALVLAAFACVWLFPAGRERFCVALALSFPLGEALMVGQDISLVLLIVLAASWIFSCGREFLAGLVASLLMIKITFLPAAGMVFLAKSRRGTGGFVVGAAIQLAISFAVGGAGWPAEYLALLRDPRLDLEPQRMPNIRAVVESLALPGAVYMIAAVALYLVFWFACKRLSLADGLSIALALGLIASPHAKPYDGAVLIPLFVKVASLDSWEGWLAYAGLTPVLYVMLLMAKPPFLGVASSLLVVAVVAAALQLYRMRTPSAGGEEGAQTPGTLRSAQLA